MSHPSPANPIQGLALHSPAWLACAGMLAVGLPAWLALAAGWLASLSLVWLRRAARPAAAQNVQPIVATPDWQRAQGAVDEHLGTLQAHAGQIDGLLQDAIGRLGDSFQGLAARIEQQRAHSHSLIERYGEQSKDDDGMNFQEFIAIRRVADIMAEISAASAEQSRGIEEVNGAVSQMDEMTQQNAALVEQAAAAAEALQEQAGLMAQSVAVFKLDPAHTGQPAALAAEVQRRGRPLRFWSAASSTGEEPYSMAIALHQALGERARNLQIIASDIDTGVLETARRGVYPLERIARLEPALKKRYFQRGTGANTGLARVVPELRQMVEFRRINLLDSDWHLVGGLDAIFCRNVMIYFDKPTQVRLLERMVRLLRPDGLFFAGHSESFVQAGHLVKLVSRTVYRPVPGVAA